MKIPCIIDLCNPGAKDWINKIIADHGNSRDYNELAMTVYCKDDVGTKFEVVQFHRTRHLVHILSGS